MSARRNAGPGERSVLIGVDAWHLNGSRDAQVAETAITTGNLTRSVAQQAQITVAFIDSILIGIVERVQAEAVAPWPESGLHELGGLHELLAKRAA